jgi:hypothetical protein
VAFCFPLRRHDRVAAKGVSSLQLRWYGAGGEGLAPPSLQQTDGVPRCHK